MSLISSMNPTAPLTTEAAALAAAKVSAVGMVVGAVKTAVEGWYTSTPEASAKAAEMIEQLTGQTQDASAMAQQSQIGLYTAGFFVLLQLVLAFVQWKKPNVVLPILFLVLVIWGLGGAILALAVPALGAAQPLWLTLFVLVTMLIAAITHIAGIRGAGALSKIRRAEMPNY
jgi:phage-related minor tail protein